MKTWIETLSQRRTLFLGASGFLNPRRCWKSGSPFTLQRLGPNSDLADSVHKIASGHSKLI